GAFRLAPLAQRPRQDLRTASGSQEPPSPTLTPTPAPAPGSDTRHPNAGPPCRARGPAVARAWPATAGTPSVRRRPSRGRAPDTTTADPDACAPTTAGTRVSPRGEDAEPRRSRDPRTMP